MSGVVPISGGGDASAANQTSGAQKTQIVDAGGEQATVTGGRLDVNATVTPSGTQDVDVVANTIGLATGAKQDTLLAELQLKADLTETQPVSLASVPLPTGAATSALQGTGNTSLATIAGAVAGTEIQVDVLTMPTTTVQATNLDIRDLTFAADKVDASGSTGVGVTGTFFQATQPVSAAALPLPSGAATEATLTSIDSGIPAGLGQAVMAASMPVVIASNQTAIPISGTVTVDTSLLATAAKQDAQTALLTTIDADTGNIATSTATVAGAVSGSEMQVDIVASLPAGNNNIGDVDIASGTITAVTTITNPVTVTATNLDIRDLTFAADKVDASGTILGAGNNNIGDVDVASVAGNVTVVQPTGTNLHTVIDSGTLTTVSTVTAVTAITNALPAGTNIIGRVGIDQTTPGTTNKVSLSDTAGQAQYNFPAGFQRTTDEPRQLFYDPFDKAPLDYVNKWKSPFVTDGAVDAVISGGLVIESTTTASAASSLESLPTFIPPIPGWLGISFAIQLEAVPITNANRFWGIGTSPTSPTATAPLTNAVGFELYTDGKLYAVVYASGVRTVIADLSSSGTGTQPLDGAAHRYIIYYRTDRTFFYFDSLATAVATTNFQSPTIQVLPVKFHAIANSTPPASSAVLTCLGMAVWDTAKNNSTISDGTNPFYRAKVNYDGELSVLAGVTAGKNAPYDITGERAMNVKSNELRQTQEDIYIMSYASYMREIAGTRGYELR